MRASLKSAQQMTLIDSLSSSEQSLLRVFQKIFPVPDLAGGGPGAQAQA